MQQVWLALIGGLILGWLIEWIIDWKFWRRNLAELREENQALRRQLVESQAQLAAAQAVPATAPGAAVEAPLDVSPETPAEVSAVAPVEASTQVPDAARKEENTLGVAVAPADPRTEGE